MSADRRKTVATALAEDRMIAADTFLTFFFGAPANGGFCRHLW